MIEAHIPVSNGPVTRFIATQHYSSTWVYAERAAGKGATVVDVTRPNHPKVVSEVPTGALVSVNGTTALSTDAPGGAAAEASPQTIRLMDFSDAAHPKVTRQFDGVTAIQKIGGNLILLANPEGIWILSEHLADDPAADARYAKKVIYGESMY
jgi:hypothetical protein